MEKKNQLSSPSCSRRKECRRDGIDPRVTTVSAKRAKEKKKIFSHVFLGKTYSIRLGMFLKKFCVEVHASIHREPPLPALPKEKDGTLNYQRPGARFFPSYL